MIGYSSIAVPVCITNVLLCMYVHPKFIVDWVLLLLVEQGSGPTRHYRASFYPVEVQPRDELQVGPA